jgi:hypothetical protein
MRDSLDVTSPLDRLPQKPDGYGRNTKDAVMVTVDCPMCLGPVTLLDEDVELTCEECSIHVEFAPDDEARVVAHAA